MIPTNEFKREVSNWAHEVGVEPKEIHFRNLMRKWASCSSKGRLTFSYELLGKTSEERAIVIVHELLHLKYPEHGKLFNSLLCAHLGKKGITHTEAILKNL